MTLRSWLARGVFIMAGGCSTSSLDGPIDYEVTGGIAGRGDGTPALHIELDGTMTRTAPDGTTETIALDPATLDGLRDKIERADLASLASYYQCCADDYVHRVSAAVDGTTRTVMADRSADVPGRLEAAIDALHDLATRE
jgi:hypothetical protein